MISKRDLAKGNFDHSDHRPPKLRRRYGVWRGLSLFAVYVLMAIHIAHWLIATRTLAPLELNEVMYTAELGIVTAGFLFMVLIMVTTLVFGRYFCGWACHILALQDLCALLLAKVNARPKPIRMRFFKWAPFAVMTYMFVWPQIVRIASSQPLPKLHLAGDAQGWASFITEDYWRNLPGPTVTILTFLVCGFAIVYLLGSRSFCTYVCPYGAIFSIVDKVSPGGIRLKVAENPSDCLTCGVCTGVCQSHIRVHEEVAAFGQVVSSGCLKDLDCVAACPGGKLQTRFGTPSFLKRPSSLGNARQSYEFTILQELGAIVIFFLTFWSLRGLYGEVPFLLAVTAGLIFSYLALKGLQVITRANVRQANFQLKSKGKITRSGTAIFVVLILCGFLVGHSGYVRYHEYAGESLFRKIAFGTGGTADATDLGLAREAINHLRICAAWGLVRPVALDRKLASLHGLLGRTSETGESLRRVVHSDPGDIEARIRLAPILHSQGKVTEALELLLAAINIGPRLSRETESNSTLRADAARLSGEIRLVEKQFSAAERDFETSLRIHETAAAHANLARIYGARGDFKSAAEQLRHAKRLQNSVIEWRLLLAEAFARGRQLEQAIRELEQTIIAFSTDARPNIMLGQVWMHQKDHVRARESFQNALTIEPSNQEALFYIQEIDNSNQSNTKLPTH